MEVATWREESFVASGLVDVASKGDEVAVVYHQAADRALVQYLDGSLAPVAQYPWDGAIDPSRLTATDDRFVLLAIRPTEAWLVEPPGGVFGMVTGDVEAGGLSRHDPAFPRIGALLYGPTFASPTLVEVDLTTATLAARVVPALGGGTEAIDARFEHSSTRSAYVVAYATSSGVYLAEIDHTSLDLLSPPIAVLPPGMAVPTNPDLSLALSGYSRAVAMRTTAPDLTSPAALAIVNSAGVVSHLYDPADPGTAAAVGSQEGLPVFGVARVVGDELHLELRVGVGTMLLASVVVSAATEGDILDVEAEPAIGSFLVARKHREGGGPLTVTRIQCRIGTE